MTIETKLNTIDTALKSIKQSIINKGVTPSGNITTYATAIDNLILPSGTYNITDDGIYDISQYANVNVNVSAFGVSIHDMLGTVNSQGVLTSPNTNFNLVCTGVRDISTGCLKGTFLGNLRIGSCSFPDLVNVSGSSALQETFKNCTNLTSASFPNLETISSSGLASALSYSNVTNLNLPKLTTVGQNGCGNLSDYNHTLVSVNFPEVTTVAPSGFSYAFNFCTSLTSASFPKVTTIGQGSFSNAFYKTKLTNMSFPSLISAIGNSALSSIFGYCETLISATFPNLTTVEGNNVCGYMYNRCKNLTTIDFSSLQRIGKNISNGDYQQFQSAFSDCDLLTSISFPKLEKIYCTYSSASYGTFANNNKVQKFYFPKLDTITYGEGASSSNQTACKNIFYNCPALTELHFGAANQAAIEASPGYSTAWGRGAGNVTIYFDL